MDQNKPVYICSPLSAPSHEGILRNMLAARDYVRAVGLELQNRALAPHAWLPELLEDTAPEERILAMEFGKQLLALCGTLLVCHPTITKGMAEEIAIAKQLGLDIFVRSSPNQYCPARRIPEVGATADWRAWRY